VTSQQFIFSSERKFIWARHLSFWIAFSIACFITGSYPYRPKDLLSSGFYLVSLEWVVCFLPVSVLLTYLFLNLILPVFSKKRNYLKIFFLIFFAVVFNIIVTCLLNKVSISWSSINNKEEILENLQLSYFHSIVFTILLACLITAVIVIKRWYVQMKENTKLYKQKIYNELSLFKSQIYPTFLFNSLTTLYNQIGYSSNEAAKYLLILSDILSYILYDSGDELVLLNKEIIIIKNYIEVVKNDGINNNIIITENISSYNKYISPLILFSLLESVISETYKYPGEEPCINISISDSERNNSIEFIVLCYLKDLHIADQYQENKIKEIQNRLKILPMINQELNVVKNESSFSFSVQIKTSDTINAHNNAYEIEK